jgi:hypothetical protein
VLFAAFKDEGEGQARSKVFDCFFPISLPFGFLRLFLFASLGKTRTKKKKKKKKIIHILLLVALN